MVVVVVVVVVASTTHSLSSWISFSSVSLGWCGWRIVAGVVGNVDDEDSFTVVVGTAKAYCAATMRSSTTGSSSSWSWWWWWLLLLLSWGCLRRRWRGKVDGGCGVGRGVIPGLWLCCCCCCCDWLNVDMLIVVRMCCCLLCENENEIDPDFCWRKDQVLSCLISSVTAGLTKKIRNSHTVRSL